MYYDSSGQPYIHNHAIYKCKCGKQVATCPCPDPGDKELIVFDTCNHGDVKYLVDEQGVYRKALLQPGGAKKKTTKKKTPAKKKVKAVAK